MSASAKTRTFVSVRLFFREFEENTFGPKGIVQARKKGLIHVEMSTLHPTWQKSLAERLTAEGIEMLDAPISVR
ncbi:MAG: NAD(P)-binding domain-containing protein [Burkholderiales bacterium]|nr:NAD(P)-binding domain-containing protein [Burkholderiales bacterium]